MDYKTHLLSTFRKPPADTNNCAVRQFTGDGRSVGRCWHYVRDGKCPVHDDVRAIQDHYARTGELTDEINHKLKAPKW